MKNSQILAKMFVAFPYFKNQIAYKSGGEVWVPGKKEIPSEVLQKMQIVAEMHEKFCEGLPATAEFPAWFVYDYIDSKGTLNLDKLVPKLSAIVEFTTEELMSVIEKLKIYCEYFAQKIDVYDVGEYHLMDNTHNVLFMAGTSLPYQYSTMLVMLDQAIAVTRTNSYSLGNALKEQNDGKSIAELYLKCRGGVTNATCQINEIPLKRKGIITLSFFGVTFNVNGYRLYVDNPEVEVTSLTKFATRYVRENIDVIIDYVENGENFPENLSVVEIVNQARLKELAQN